MCYIIIVAPQRSITDMQKMRNLFMAQLLTGLCITLFPEFTAWAQIPPYSPDLCRNGDSIAPLIITIENDTDVDLNIIAPRAYSTYVRPSENNQPPTHSPA